MHSSSIYLFIYSSIHPFIRSYTYPYMHIHTYIHIYSTDYEDLMRRSHKSRVMLYDLLVREADLSRKTHRETCDINNTRIAFWSFKREGHSLQECWQEGQAFKEIRTKAQKVKERRETIEKQKKNLLKKKPAKGKYIHTYIHKYIHTYIFCCLLSPTSTLTMHKCTRTHIHTHIYTYIKHETLHIKCKI